MDENNQYSQQQGPQGPQQYDTNQQYAQPQGNPYAQQQYQAPQPDPYAQQQYQAQPQYQQPQQQFQNNQVPPQQPPKKKSYMGLVLGIVGGLLVLIIITIIVFVLLFKAVAKKASDEISEIAATTEEFNIEDYTFDLDITTESTSEAYATEEDSSSDVDVEADPADVLPTSKLDFGTKNWTEIHDSSYLVPEAGNSYKYYQSKDDMTNYYYTGEFEYYEGDERFTVNDNGE